MKSLAQNFKFSSLLRFAAPTIAMTIFMSLYTVVDGFFVSRFIGTNALSAVNIVFPLVSLFIAVAVMFASGGSAVVAFKLGQGKESEARSSFTLVIVLGLVVSIALAAVALVFVDTIVRMLGGTELLFDMCKDYVTVLLWFMPIATLQMLFQTFFVTAGKPYLGLIFTVIAGILNVVLDYLFIAVLHMGIQGAAFATVIGYFIPAAAGAVFFFANKGSLRFSKFKWHKKVIADVSLNGSSEMITNLSNCVITFLTNYFALQLLGENGVAAATILLYTQYLISSFFMGFSMGTAPVISYKYGEGNTVQLKSIFKMCIWFVPIASVAFTLIAFFLSPYISSAFAGLNPPVMNIANEAFHIFVFCFLFQGMNIFASSFFTALSNGKISALISILRTLVFTAISLVMLPMIFKAPGIWASVPVAEALTLFFSVWLLVRYKKSYKY